MRLLGHPSLFCYAEEIGSLQVINFDNSDGDYQYIETLESGVLLTAQAKKQEIKNIYLDNTVVPGALIILFSEMLKFSKKIILKEN